MYLYRYVPPVSALVASNEDKAVHTNRQVQGELACMVIVVYSVSVSL